MDKNEKNSLDRLLTFAKNHRPGGGFGNLYLIQKENRDGEVIDEYYGDGYFAKKLTPATVAKLAKKKYKEKLDGQNYPLEYKIYKALVDLYTELANQQEQMKNYIKAIDLLNKLLEILDNIKSISGKVKDCMTEKQMEDTKTEAYLKISNIYYRIKDYDNTIKTLDLIPNINLNIYPTMYIQQYIILLLFPACSILNLFRLI